jgi:proton glutamate symport protein
LNGAKKRNHVVVFSLAGLALGFGLGILAHSSGNSWLQGFADIVGPLGKLWTNALQIVVIPLVASLLFSCIGSMPSGKAFGMWGWASAATFFALLVLGAVFTVAVTKLYLSIAPPMLLTDSTTAETSKAAGFTFGDWITGLMPANLFEALAKGELLPIIMLTILLALAARQLPKSRKGPLVGFMESVRDAILVYVHWVMALLPFGAFALAFSFASEKGLAAAGVVLSFLVLILLLLIAFTLILYPIASIFGRVPVWTFAKAAAPPQAVAISSRSSVASLPALVEASENLKLPEPAGSVVLPLAVSVFKLNRTVSSTGKVLFCAAALGIALSPGDLIAFIVTVMLLSISTPGIPSTGSNLTLGAYMAAGIPAELALLFEPVEPILDMFKTSLNVTGNLASAAIVSHFCAKKPSAEPNPAFEALPAEA